MKTVRHTLRRRGDVDMRQAFGGIGMGGVFGVCASVFHDMEAAEAEIASAQLLYPEQAEEIWGTFKLLRRTEVLRDKGDTLYQKHCAEVLRRVAQGEDTRQATTAEVAAVMCNTSLEAPLDNTGSFLYASLFLKLELGDPAMRQEIRTTRDGLKVVGGSFIEEQADLAYGRIAKRLYAQWRTKEAT